MTTLTIRELADNCPNNFFSRGTMQFFGDTRRSFRLIEVDGTTYLYRRPDAMVSPLDGKRVRAGRTYFNAWRLDGYTPCLVDEKTADAIYQLVSK